jgi:hypothetical protein
MSLWQFTASVGGFAKANSTTDDLLNREEADVLAEQFIALRPDLR